MTGLPSVHTKHNLKTSHVVFNSSVVSDTPLDELEHAPSCSIRETGQHASDCIRHPPY